MPIIKLLFYKDGALIVNINLMTGNYFIPSIESSLEKRAVRKLLLQKFHIHVAEYDHIAVEGGDFLFIGEWEGMYGLDDDALRSKWVPIQEVSDEDILAIRGKYRDIVDKGNNVIGIASAEETNKYSLRHRVVRQGSEEIPFRLGESAEEIRRRLSIKGELVREDKAKDTLDIEKKIVFRASKDEE